MKVFRKCLILTMVALMVGVFGITDKAEASQPLRTDNIVDVISGPYTAEACVPGTDESEGDWYHWDDGIPTHASGYTDGGILTVATLWKPVDLPGNGHILKIRVGVGDLPSNAVIKIWQGPDLDSMELQYSQIFISMANEINEVVLDRPYVIDGSQELLFGWSATHNEEEYPCSHDVATDPNQQGNLFLSQKTGTWKHFSSEGDWIIGAFIDSGEPCLSDDDCDEGLFCYAGDGLCYECLVNADCPDGESCENDLCVVETQCPEIEAFDDDESCLLSKDELNAAKTFYKNKHKDEKNDLKLSQAEDKAFLKSLKEYAE